jgi:hypothetical protein
MKSFAEPVAHVIYQVNNYSEWPQAGSLQPLAPHLNDHEICARAGCSRSSSCQIKSRAQLKTARLLLLRDGN